MLLANLNFSYNGTQNVTTRISGYANKVSFEVPLHWKNNVTFFLQQSRGVMVLQEEHIISSGSTMHLHFGHTNFCFNVSRSKLRMYPVASVYLESVRFLVSKHISCETVAIDVSVVLISRVSIYFDTHKSVKESIVCSSTFSANFPKKVIEISSVWSFKDAFLKLICCSFFSTISMGLTLYPNPVMLTTSKL